MATGLVRTASAIYANSTRAAALLLWQRRKRVGNKPIKGLQQFCHKRQKTFELVACSHEHNNAQRQESLILLILHVLVTGNKHIKIRCCSSQ